MLESIKDFRLGCSKGVALMHLNEAELAHAIRTSKLEEVDGLYYSVPTRGGDDIRAYLGKAERPLRWNKNCEWSLPGYVPS